MEDIEKLRKQKKKLETDIKETKEINKLKKEISSLNREKKLNKFPFLQKIKDGTKSINNYLIKMNKRFD
jgi:hypothetical protein